MQKNCKKKSGEKKNVQAEKIDIENILRKLPKNRPLNELDIHKYAKDIPFWKGTIMRDEFKNLKCDPIEAAVGNLNLSSELGSHWYAYWKLYDTVIYYDSFGNLQPTKELIAYFKKDNKNCQIYYNRRNFQSFNTFFCGQMCLIFLYSVLDKFNKM